MVSRGGLSSSLVSCLKKEAFDQGLGVKSVATGQGETNGSLKY